MERAEPFVPRDFETAIITFEIPVMHLVVERTKGKAVLVIDQQPLKARMRGDRGQEVILQVENDV